MRRREFIKLIGGAATWPLAAHAQQTAMPVIGIISAGSRSGFDDLLNEFRLGLKDFGMSKARPLRSITPLQLVGSINFHSLPAIWRGAGSPS
jgi:hypothetical protein